MFIVIAVAANYAGSTELLFDILDNLGDALTCALSLYAANLGAHTKALVALLKGLLIPLAALVVVGQIAYKQVHP